MKPLVAVHQQDDLLYPSDSPYHPGIPYPEMENLFPVPPEVVAPNPVYHAVRQTFRMLGLDGDRFGTAQWNPLGKYVQPGFTVVIKPNLVLHESGELLGQNCLITHGAVIRPLVDYTYLALRGRGEIWIADAPLLGAKFDVIGRQTGIYDIQAFYHETLGFNLRIADLRQVCAVWDEETGYLSECLTLPGDPKGYVTIDLKKVSAFEVPDNLPPLDTCRFGVTGYSAQSTQSRHAQGRHEYIISRTLLEADTVIVAPKLKVHEKVGLTACLKGMVGIVGSKDCLPHFRIGSPSQGGDEFMEKGRWLAASWTSVRNLAQGRVPIWLWSLLRCGGKKLSRIILGYKKGGFRDYAPATSKPVIGGAWFGNDTAWRMVADLNHIILYADTAGELCPEPQRRFFALVDGIIAGEGNGPLAPSPRPLGFLIGGDNLWAVDVVSASIIGMDWRKLPMLKDSVWRPSRNLAPSEIDPGIRITWNRNGFCSFAHLTKTAVPLTPSPGWVGHIESNKASEEGSSRIIILGPSPPPYSGPEVMTQALVEALSRRPGMTVKYLNTQVSRSLAEKGGKHQLRKSLSAARQTARLVWLMLTFSPDLVYMPLTNSPSFLGFLRDAMFMITALAFGKKFAIRMHGGYYVYAHTRGWQRTLVKAFLKRVSLAMVQGRRLTGVFDGLVPESRLAIIPNGIDEAPFAAARERLPAVPNPYGLKRVLFVGFMAPGKGFRDVIAAIPLTPAAHFIFMGEWLKPEDEKEVRGILRQQGVEDRVNFTGIVSGPEKYDLFVSADIFVFPTYYAYEGHAVCCVEALAAGLPIVCTDHGALNESVQDGWNGFFVPPSNPAAIARCLNQLLQDEGLRRSMGERSRQLYLERFTLPQFVDKWSRAIQGCCAGNYRRVSE